MAEGSQRWPTIRADYPETTWSRNPAPAALAEPLQYCGRNVADTPDRVRRCPIRPSNCVRECQHSAAGQVLDAAAGNDRASRTRRRPSPLVATAPNRRPDSLVVRHCRRNRRRALVPECFGACVSGAGSGHHCQSAGPNRLARSGGERRRLRAHDIVVRPRSVDSSEHGDLAGPRHSDQAVSSVAAAGRGYDRLLFSFRCHSVSF